MDYQAYLKSEEWKRLRSAVLQRDNHQCQTCLSKQKLEVHHKTYERLGKEDLNDLITLCHACHEAITKSINSGKSQKLFPFVSERPKLSLTQRAELLLIKVCSDYPDFLSDVLSEFEERNLKRSPEYESMWTAVSNGDRPEQIDTLSPVSLSSNLKGIPHTIKCAFLSIERELRFARYQHFLNLWQETNPEEDVEKWHSYYQAYYSERLALQEIDKQRQYIDLSICKS